MRRKYLTDSITLYPLMDDVFEIKITAEHFQTKSNAVQYITDFQNNVLTAQVFCLSLTK
jgi:dihydroorotase